MGIRAFQAEAKRGTDPVLHHVYGIKQQVEGRRDLQGFIIVAKPSGQLAAHRIPLGHDQRHLTQVLRGHMVKQGQRGIIADDHAPLFPMRQADERVAADVRRLQQQPQIEQAVFHPLADIVRCWRNGC